MCPFSKIEKKWKSLHHTADDWSYFCALKKERQLIYIRFKNIAWPGLGYKLMDGEKFQN